MTEAHVGITSVLRRYCVGIASVGLVLACPGNSRADGVERTDVARDFSTRCLSVLTEKNGWRAFRGAELQSVYKNQTTFLMDGVRGNVSNADGPGYGCASTCSFTIKGFAAPSFEAYAEFQAELAETAGLERYPFPVKHIFMHSGEIETGIGIRFVKINVNYDARIETLTYLAESHTVGLDGCPEVET